MCRDGSILSVNRKSIPRLRFIWRHEARHQSTSKVWPGTGRRFAESFHNNLRPCATSVKISLTQSVREVCMYFIEKFTGGAGERIIDEAPRRVPGFEGVRTGIVFARGDPNDQIYEEDENFSRNCLSVQRDRRSPIYKRILQCVFVVFRVIILVGSFSGVIGLLIIYVVLNTLYHCKWIESTNPSLPLTTKRVREITDIIAVLLIDHWLFFIWITIFTWSAFVKSRVLQVNTIFLVTDVTYRIVLQSQNLYIKPFIPYSMNFLYVLVLLVHSYSLGRLYFRNKKTVLKVAITRKTLCSYYCSYVYNVHIYIRNFPVFCVSSWYEQVSCGHICPIMLPSI